MTESDVVRAMEQAAVHGVRAAWFTGGEPFLHPRILALTEHVLARAPLGILTNGMLIDQDLAVSLGHLARASEYNLEIRVSLDGSTQQANDRVRGRGVFAKATAGISNLAAQGLNPIVAVTLLDDVAENRREDFIELLRSLGVHQPRVKWIPPFRLGRESRRRGGRSYLPHERITDEDLTEPDAPHRLQCGTSRTITSQGVFPCPILINESRYRLGDDLEPTLRSHPVDHPACRTCWDESFSCSV
jgi:MoaA/NifB/PqqE/SkfB family radical SAM enzyme